MRDGDAEPQAGYPASTVATRPHEILVVEDDPDIRESVVGILEAEGYAVRGAEHGAMALQCLRANSPPCLIVLDLMMPVMDGWTFCMEKDKDPSERVKAPDVPATFEGRAEKARKELLNSYHSRQQRLAQPGPLDAASTFLNAIAAALDPHTLYLAPADMI